MTRLNSILITIGDIELMKEKWKGKSFCSTHENIFNYHNIPNALCGKTYPKRFTMKRLVVVQFVNETNQIHSEELHDEHNQETNNEIEIDNQDITEEIDDKDKRL